MADVELIGVPFDGYGRPGNQARAAAVLRAAGLGAALAAHHRVVDGGDVVLPAPDPRRGAATSLVNEPGVLAVADTLHDRVGAAVGAGRFPVVFGGDCTTLLGTVPGLRTALGAVGLLFVDGHEDTMPLDVSEDGEAANAEIGLLLGLTGRLDPGRRWLATLDRAALAMLGMRDEQWRRRFDVGSLRDAGVWLRDVDEVAADPAGCAREAVAHVRRTAPRWWLHVDLDVLDPVEFAAQGLPDVPDDPGGLAVAQLTDLLAVAAGQGGCLGLSLAIYDPDQDPDGADAERVVALVRAVGAALAG